MLNEPSFENKWSLYEVVDLDGIGLLIQFVLSPFVRSYLKVKCVISANQHKEHWNCIYD